MIWEVYYTNKAEFDLNNIFDYISDVLIEPIIAEKQTERIKKAVNSLDFMPFRHPIYDREPWKSQGVRIFLVDNYSIFYLPDESQSTVEVISIIYSGRDINQHLPKPGKETT